MSIFCERFMLWIITSGTNMVPTFTWRILKLMIPYIWLLAILKGSRSCRLIITTHLWHQLWYHIFDCLQFWRSYHKDSTSLSLWAVMWALVWSQNLNKHTRHGPNPMRKSICWQRQTQAEKLTRMPLPVQPNVEYKNVACFDCWHFKVMATL